MKFQITIIIFLLTAIYLPGWSKAKGAQPDGSKYIKGQYGRYQKLPSQKLLDLGKDFLYNKGMPDSAFLCYTIVAERYRPDMSQKDVALCLEGYYGRWNSRFMHTKDIPAAMQDLSAAQEIIERTSLPAAKLDCAYGQAYLCINIASGFKPEFFRSAIDCFRRSCASALRQKDYRTFHSAFNNLVIAASEADSTDVLLPFVKALRTLREPEMTQRSFSLLWYEGAMAQTRRQYEKAVAIYDSLTHIVPEDVKHIRMKTNALLQKVTLLMQLGRLKESDAIIDTLTSISYRFRQPDIRINAYNLRSLIAERQGMKERAHDYHTRYLELKDSLSVERQTADFQEIVFSTKRRALQRDIDAANYRSRLRGNTIIFSTVIVILLLVFAAWLVRHNRRLRRRSEMLYRQLQSTINSNAWIDSAPALMSEDTKETENETEQPADDVPQTEPEKKEDIPETPKTPEKYAGSGLSDDVANDLVLRIRQFLLSSEAIYSPDFSMAAFASELDTNRQYLSQCINQHFGCNFSTLVNRARIRRAMILLDNEQSYGHYSIEGIAESVGFRTRGSFNLWFRKFTGLSAAEYRKLGKSLRPTL